MKYFSICAGCDYHFHETEDEAKKACEEHLSNCRSVGGWEYDDEYILEICWGEIKERMGHVPAPEDEWEFQLKEAGR